MNNRKNSSTNPLKTQAKALRTYLSEQGIELGHGKCLEAVAGMYGYKNWDAASGALKTVALNNSDTRDPDEVPYAVIVSRSEWAAGDSVNYDAFDYFGRSFLGEESQEVSGHPDAVRVHAALWRGETVPLELAPRVLAVCYSEDDFEEAWERLVDAFKHINPVRRAALWRVWEGNPYPYPERLHKDLLPLEPLPLFFVTNGHVASSGKAPKIDGDEAGCFFSYFENHHGEQAVLRWDHDAVGGTLWMGDCGWEEPVHVDSTGGMSRGLVLNAEEKLWLEACMKAVGFD